jgi:hypothetical protein
MPQIKNGSNTDVARAPNPPTESQIEAALTAPESSKPAKTPPGEQAQQSAKDKQPQG